MRLDKLLYNLKYGSRKTIKMMAKKGKILVNSIPTYSSDIKIDPNYDKIIVNGHEVFYKENIILAFNKPSGYLSSHEDELYPSLFHWIEAPYHQFDLKIAGRLDYDSEGLMILTTDGKLVHQITHPNGRVQKVYEVILDKALEQKDAHKLLKGFNLPDGKGEPYEAKALNLTYDQRLATITIDEGKFHQVKNMFSKLGYEVLKLKRVQIGKLMLDLAPGAYKEIEISDIFER